MKKSLLTLLTIFLTADPAQSQILNDAPNTTLHSFLPAQCIADELACACFTPDAVAYIAEEIRDADTSRYEIEQYKNYAANAEKQAWYSDPTLVVGGMVVGISVAGVIGYLIGSRK
jgi:hypothetical protein